MLGRAEQFTKVSESLGSDYHWAALRREQEVSDVFNFQLRGQNKRFALSQEVDLTLRAGIDNVFDDYQDDLESGPTRDSDYVYSPGVFPSRR